MTDTKPLKIVLLGDPGTGKTNLFSRVTKNHFNEKNDPSPGMTVTAHEIYVGAQTVEAYLWDLGGDEKHLCLRNSCLGDADGILLVYDISNAATFGNLATWLRHIREAASPKTVIKLVGNKDDLQSMVPRKEAEQFATDHGLSYIETSALNDNNVHLAFESMAQEINVAKQSVSESPLSSTNSFAKKKPKASSDDDDQQEKPFQVVLIDIEQAARDKYIVCVEKPLEEPNLEFIAISYRWGEVVEQVIDTNVGYIASITSFHLDHFYQLCRDMMKETDLHSIKYVWVDAICVDQNSHDRRKATIYQMSNIYRRAAYILAVPDLHLKYLENNQIFTGELQKNLYHISNFIYYLLHGKIDQLVQAKEEWYNEMGIPKGKAREMLTKITLKRFTDYLQPYHLQDADSPCQNPCQYPCWHNCYVRTFNDCHNTPKAMLDNLQHSIDYCHDHPKDPIFVRKNSDCALCSLRMEICKHERRIKNRSVPVANEKWLACLLREFQYDNYRNSVEERSIAVDRFMYYLEYLIKDWSSRAWVVSECNIAKAKQSRKMKYWFLSLSFSWKDVEKLDFFVFDFDRTQNDELFPKGNAPRDRVTHTSDLVYKRFQRTMMSQLNEKSFVEMMLGSKASRNEDRFHAIFPSTEYKDLLTSREVVSSWQIDTIVSVRLKLFELMTTKDKLNMLNTMSCQFAVTYCTFPAFANINLECWRTDPITDYNYDDRPCNFDLNNDATLRLVSPMENENGFPFHKLSLSPKSYYTVHARNDYMKEIFNGIFNDSKRLWEALEINDVEDELVYVYMPIYDHAIGLDDDVEGISLFGSFKKNKWLISKDVVALLHRPTARFPIALSCLRYYNNSDGNTTFDIY